MKLLQSFLLSNFEIASLASSFNINLNIQSNINVVPFFQIWRSNDQMLMWSLTKINLNILLSQMRSISDDYGHLQSNLCVILI